MTSVQAPLHDELWWPLEKYGVSHILLICHLISRRNAFIAIFVPKLVAVVTPLWPLCTGESQMNSPVAQTLSQNQTLHGCVAYNWSYCHFCNIFAYFGQNLVDMATSLGPCNQRCLISIGWPQNRTLELKILSIAVTQAKLCRFEGSQQV